MDINKAIAHCHTFLTNYTRVRLQEEQEDFIKGAIEKPRIKLNRDLL